MNADRILVHTAIQQTEQHYRHLDRELPEGLTQALEDIDAQRQRTLTPHNPIAMRDAVDAALAAGNDPATDPAVLVELARRQLQDVKLGPLLDELAEQRRGAGLRQHAPVILADLALVVEEADATLTNARAEIPNLDPTDPTTITALKPGQMALWGEAREALDHLERVTQMWHLIVSACRLAPLNANKRPLILADLTGDELAALSDRTAMAPVHAGHHLELATPETYMQRCKRVDEDQAAEQAKREREARTGRREGAAA